MDDPNFNPDLVAKAKKISALDREMAKFPLRFAIAAFFGDRLSKNKTSRINHGTITLLELKGNQIALTCSHVLDEYRKINMDPKVVFQIGNLDFNPLERIIDESSKLDLVSIDVVRKNYILGICAKGLRLSDIKFNATGLKPTLFSVYPELFRILCYQ